MNNSQIENVNVESIRPLSSPNAIKLELPITGGASRTVVDGRDDVVRILNGEDRRALALVGPCSIHDDASALEYAERLKDLQYRLANMFLVMRVYFEKPRSTTGWTGLIMDPDLDGSFDMEKGLRLARDILISIGTKGVPCGTEFLSPFVVPYIADLVAWGAIGARTTESQTHRQMASGLSMPIGFKNGTGGSLDIAAQAIVSAGSPHQFLSIDNDGRASVVQTKGNPNCHLILRGGKSGANFSSDSVRAAEAALAVQGLGSPKIVVDCSHANSDKKWENQEAVLQSMVQQRASGDKSIIGFMLESNLKAGQQSIADAPLQYGVSITDACVGWEDTERILLEADKALG